jgi:hypothetical protein
MKLDENLLRRTAGPYIRVKLNRSTMSAQCRLGSPTPDLSLHCGEDAPDRKRAASSPTLRSRVRPAAAGVDCFRMALFWLDLSYGSLLRASSAWASPLDDTPIAKSRPAASFQETALPDHDLYPQQSASSHPPQSTSRISARESHEAARFYTTRVTS